MIVVVASYCLWCVASEVACCDVVTANNEMLKPCVHDRSYSSGTAGSRLATCSTCSSILRANRRCYERAQ